MVAIGNSYGVAETAQEAQWDTLYHHPGSRSPRHQATAATAPATRPASPLVTAVGGTSLRRDSSPRGWSETPWSGASSGCSRYEPKPSWQHDPGCIRRTIADVSADADPGTGVAMYDSYQSARLDPGGRHQRRHRLHRRRLRPRRQQRNVVGGSYPYAHSDALNQVGGGYTPSGGSGTPAGTKAF